ncbi:MAG: hypothetical protein LUG26_09600 [Ruminococcus sp.]|nr:hypothetical protein [Ruminococcus sp.]
MKLKKIISCMTSVVLSLSTAAGLTISNPETGSSADAAGEVLMFDFGGRLRCAERRCTVQKH